MPSVAGDGQDRRLSEMRRRRHTQLNRSSRRLGQAADRHRRARWLDACDANATWGCERAMVAQSQRGPSCRRRRRRPKRVERWRASGRVDRSLARSCAGRALAAARSAAASDHGTQITTKSNPAPQGPGLGHNDRVTAHRAFGPEDRGRAYPGPQRRPTPRPSRQRVPAHGHSKGEAASRTQWQRRRLRMVEVGPRNAALAVRTASRHACGRPRSTRARARDARAR